MDARQEREHSGFGRGSLHGLMQKRCQGFRLESSLSENPVHLFSIFGRVDRTGTVQQYPSGLYALYGGPDDALLQRYNRPEVVGGKPVFDIGVSGNDAQAAQALGQLPSLSAASAAMQSAKSAALGGQGQGKGQGQGQGQGGSGPGQGQSAGSGAGQGSTNEDAGAGSPGGKQSASAGGREGRYHLGEYEQIYDPTRLGDGGEITQSTGKVDENAQMSELTLSPGLGSTAGSIPYDQVVGEYQAAAVQRAQEAALPGYAQQWVADYFSALTE